MSGFWSQSKRRPKKKKKVFAENTEGFRSVCEWRPFRLKQKVFITNYWSYGFTWLNGVNPKWWHPERAAPRPLLATPLHQDVTVDETFCPQHYFHWNDRRLRRVFLCFYSAIFQLTSAKLQTFAYNSRTVWSSYMKFWHQFESNDLYVCTKFRGNRSRDFGFRTRKPLRKFGVKSGLSQKRLKYGKKYFIELYVLRYPFIPTNPRLAAMRLIFLFFSFFFLFFLFFFLFFLPNFCTLFFS